TADKPSRAADKGCAWEKASDAAAGLEAWVERCDYGFRKVDFLFKGSQLMLRYSDAADKPEPLIDVFDLQPGETPEAGLKRVFAAHTQAALAARCELSAYKGPGEKPPARVKRYTFLPNAALAKELAQAAKKNGTDGDVPEPPCGDWGDSADGIQYYEVHEG